MINVMSWAIKLITLIFIQVPSNVVSCEFWIMWFVASSQTMSYGWKAVCIDYYSFVQHHFCVEDTHDRDVHRFVRVGGWNAVKWSYIQISGYSPVKMQCTAVLLDVMYLKNRGKQVEGVKIVTLITVCWVILCTSVLSSILRSFWMYAPNSLVRNYYQSCSKLPHLQNGHNRVIRFPCLSRRWGVIPSQHSQHRLTRSIQSQIQTCMQKENDTIPWL